MNNKPKFKLMGLRQLFLPENLLHEDRPYWAEKGIDNLIKKFELIERSNGEKEFENNLEEKKSDPREEELIYKFDQKYPFIEKDPHIYFCMWLIRAKMDMIEGWDDEKISHESYYEELGKRVERLFPNLINQL